jgi:hypothetical protein
MSTGGVRSGARAVSPQLLINRDLSAQVGEYGQALIREALVIIAYRLSTLGICDWIMATPSTVNRWCSLG